LPKFTAKIFLIWASLQIFLVQAKWFKNYNRSGAFVQRDK